MVTSALNRKLLRTIRTTLGQFLALVTIVMVGVAIYLSMNTALQNLSLSKQEFYRNQHAGDYYFDVIRAPETVVNDIAKIEGVTAAEGRIKKDLTMLKPDGKRGTARVYSYHLPINRGINRLLILEGSPFRKKSPAQQVDVLVDRIFYTALQSAGSVDFEVVAEGKQVHMRASGAVVSPEFMRAILDTNHWFPEAGMFGIVMLENRQAQEILDMPGQINSIVITKAPGADETRIKIQAENILKPYGMLTSYPRKDQISNVMLDSELQELSIISDIMPMIFFLVATSMQFIILTRIIKTQRLQIGVMKALGYSSPRVILHYTSYALIASVAGTILGNLLGIVLAQILADSYSQFFSLPRTMSGINVLTMINSFFVSTAAGLASGFLASYRITRISAAEAMRAESPRRTTQKILIEHWEWAWQRLPSSLRMSLRSISRNRARSCVTILGVASAVTVLLMSLFLSDCANYMIQRQYLKENHYDYIIHLYTPVKESEINYWKRWNEIRGMEARLEVPAEFRKKGRYKSPGDPVETDQIIGLPENCRLKTALDVNDRVLPIPAEGIIISDRLANKLGLKCGDLVSGETRMGIGRERQFELKVIGINTQYLGMASFVSLDTANRIIHEHNVINSVMVDIEPWRHELFEHRFASMNKVFYVLSNQKEADNLRTLLKTIFFFLKIMYVFAMILGMSIVYNAVVTNFIERRRELASMMVLGFQKNEIARILLSDLAIQSFIGLAIGIPAGRLLGIATLDSMESALYVYPNYIYPHTYFTTAALSLLLIAAGYYISLRRVNELDMVEILKDRE